MICFSLWFWLWCAFFTIDHLRSISFFCQNAHHDWQTKEYISNWFLVKALHDKCLFACFLLLHYTIIIINTYPSSSEGGGCNLFFFFPQLFWQPKVVKRLFSIYTNPITHLLQTCIEIWGCRTGRGESSKSLVGGLAKLHDSFFFCL